MRFSDKHRCTRNRGRNQANAVECRCLPAQTPCARPARQRLTRLPHHAAKNAGLLNLLEEVPLRPAYSS